MPISDWVEDPGAWDRLEISGFVFEATDVEVEGSFGNDFDVKKAPGADGATLVNKGVEPIKPTIRWTLYTSEHAGLYGQAVDKFQPRPGKTPLPLITVIHPQLQHFKKAQFRIVRMHTLKKVGPGMMQAQWDLLEYFAEAKTTPKSDTTPSTPSRTRERAITELETSKPSNNPAPVNDVVRRP